MTVARPLLSPATRRLVSGLSAFAALAAAGARDASAQTPSPLGEWQYSAGVPLQKLFNPTVPTWQVSVGAALRATSPARRRNFSPPGRAVC